MQERARQEIRLRVTVITRRSEAAKVRISVTVYALWSSTNECLLAFGTMTTLASDLIMNALNSESTKIMLLANVYGPTVHRMAACTIGPFLTIMNIYVA